MNLLYIIGNGLDIQYGLKTKYSHFYEYQLPKYQEKQKNSKYVNVIYDNIQEDKENWSDMELSLGELTKNSEIDEEKFMQDLDDVNEDLNNYLRSEQDKFDVTSKNITIENELANLLKFIPEKDVERISDYLNNMNYTTDQIRILTFNYTNILDNLIEKVTSPVNNTFRSNSNGCSIGTVEHAHGTLEFALILGVSEESQLNIEYKDENRKYLIKESLLSKVRENRNIKNDNLINWADMIIIFGTSIGATDNYIWNKIAKNSIKKNIPILIHYYEANIELIQKLPRKIGQLYEKVENNFIEKSGIDDEKEIEVLKSNIVPIISKKIFEIKEDKSS